MSYTLCNECENVQVGRGDMCRSCGIEWVAWSTQGDERVGYAPPLTGKKLVRLIALGIALWVVLLWAGWKVFG